MSNEKDIKPTVPKPSMMPKRRAVLKSQEEQKVRVRTYSEHLYQLPFKGLGELLNYTEGR